MELSTYTEMIACTMEQADVSDAWVSIRFQTRVVAIRLARLAIKNLSTKKIFLLERFDTQNTRTVPNIQIEIVNGPKYSCRIPPKNSIWLDIIVFTCVQAFLDMADRVHLSHRPFVWALHWNFRKFAVTSSVWSDL